MAIVEPGTGRAIIEPVDDRLRITIPGRGAPLLTVFLGVWLAGWALSEIAIICAIIRGLLLSSAGEFVSGGVLIIIIPFLLFWTFGGASVACLILWNLVGREIIELDAKTLKRHMRIPLIGRSRKFAVTDIADLRFQPAAPSFMPSQPTIRPLSFNNGSIAFDYRLDTHHLGTGLDRADAKYVVAQMRGYMTALGTMGGEDER
jgi:hypothetical protein